MLQLGLEFWSYILGDLCFRYLTGIKKQFIMKFSGNTDYMDTFCFKSYIVSALFVKFSIYLLTDGKPSQR